MGIFFAVIYFLIGLFITTREKRSVGMHLVMIIGWPMGLLFLFLLWEI